MTLLDNIALWLALLLGLWGAVVGFAASRAGDERADLRQSAGRAVVALCATLLVAVAGLAWAMLRQDFNVAYVAAHSARNLPRVYAWAALYAGPGGTLLLLATWIATAGAGAALRPRPAAPPLVGAVVCVVVVGLVMAALAAAPFARLAYTPIDGQGLEPRLEEPAMLLQLPLLHASVAALTLACAVALAAQSRHADGLAAARRWLWFAWLLLSLALALNLAAAFAMRGAWSWDAANAAVLVSWLTVAVLLHRVPAPLVPWALAALGVAWALALIGVVRPDVQPPLGFALLCLGGLALFITRERVARASVRRDLALPAAAGLLVALAVAIGGLRYPAAVLGAGVGGVVAAIVARALAHRGLARRHVAVTVHMGAVLLAVAASGTTLRTQARATLRPGDSLTVRSPLGSDYTFVHLGVSRYGSFNKAVTAGAVEVARAGRRVALVSAERRQWLDVLGRPTFAVEARAGIRNGPLESVSVSLAGVAEGEGQGGRSEGAAYRFVVTPFVSWVWLGGALVVAGALLALLSRDGGRD